MNALSRTGVLTFLFTDIEGSTQRWEADIDDMSRALEHHDQLLAGAIGDNEGDVFKRTGDGFAAVFSSPQKALEAAMEGQRRLQTADWRGRVRLKVRMGLHVGEATESCGDYYGPPVNRAARVTDIANGDQIAVSDTVSRLVRGIEFAGQGEHVLKGIGTEQISFVVSSDLLEDHRPPRSRVAPVHRPLPTQPNRLIGRDTDVAAAASLFDDHRAITLVGAGGVGKSRLAIDVGRALTARYPEGVVLCELAPIGDGAAIDDAIADAIGARTQPGMTLVQSIASFLEGRQILLILDNCEHVSSTVRPVVEAILAVDGPGILATSRESIGMVGEQLYGLSPLDPDSAGFDLFCERALERDAHFRAEADDVEHVKEICRRLDGMPLAIELAAAWVRVLTPAQLVDKLDDRFRVLRGGRRGGRHETLRDTIRWSYEQLDDRQASLFDRLSVFSGGFTLAAVESVCLDDAADSIETLDVLMALVDKSMVVSQRGVGRIRFTMLETLRQFGQEQLDVSGTSSAYFLRHADYYTEMAARHGDALLSADETDIWDHLTREWANIRAAFETKLTMRELDEAASLVLALGHFASFAMRFELFAWLDDLGSEPFEDRAEAGSLYGLKAVGAYLTVKPDVISLAETGLDMDPVDRHGFCRIALSAEYLNNLLDAEKSATVTEEWVDNLDEAVLGSRLWAHAMRAFHLAAFEPSPAAAEQAVEVRMIADATGSATAAAIACWAEGLAASIADRDEAVRRWDVGLDKARSIHPVHLAVHLIVGLVIHFSASSDDLALVLKRCRDSLQEALEHHYLAGTSHLFGVTAIVLARAGDAHTGGRLLGAMEGNGHNPRANASRAISQALGAQASGCIDGGRHLSIKAAAAEARAALDAAIDRANTSH